MSDPDQPSDERPGKRRHRRASSPATTGHPDAGHWSKKAPERSAVDEPRATDASGEHRVAGRDEGTPESAQDRWWREQRPPHWE